ncbi:MAG: hypothetical protein HS122_08670 [Opitutaceae bacterium]|nr:hypothetical protein [Opitutaceae bacterium]
MYTLRKLNPSHVSTFDRLTLDQKQLVFGWLTTGGSLGRGISYQSATNRILKEFGVKISVGALQCAYTRLSRRLPLKRHPEVTVDASSDNKSISINLTLNLQK